MGISSKPANKGRELANEEMEIEHPERRNRTTFVNRTMVTALAAMSEAGRHSLPAALPKLLPNARTMV